MSTTPEERMRQRLRMYLTKVPPSVNAGSYQAAVKFKEWAVKANKAANGTKANAFVLQTLINEYEAYK